MLKFLEKIRTPKLLEPLAGELLFKREKPKAMAFPTGEGLTQKQRPLAQRKLEAISGKLLKRVETDWNKLLKETKHTMSVAGYMPEALDDTLGISRAIGKKGLPKATLDMLSSVGEAYSTASFRFAKSLIAIKDPGAAERIIPEETPHPTEILLKAIGKEEWIKTSKPVQIGPSAQEQTKRCIDSGVDPKVCALMSGSGAIFDAAITGGLAEGILRDIAGKPVTTGIKAKSARKTLEVKRGATQQEIKVAYRKKAHIYHPDKYGGSASEFVKINKAYKALTGVEPKTILIKDIARELIKKRHLFGKTAAEAVTEITPKPLLLKKVKPVDPKFIQSFKRNTAMQVGQYSKEGQAIINKLNLSKVSNVNQAVNLVEKSLPKEILANPAVKQSIENWAKTTEMIIAGQVAKPPIIKPSIPFVPKPPMPKIEPVEPAKLSMAKVEPMEPVEVSVSKIEPVESLKLEKIMALDKKIVDSFIARHGKKAYESGEIGETLERIEQQAEGYNKEFLSEHPEIKGHSITVYHDPIRGEDIAVVDNETNKIIEIFSKEIISEIQLIKKEIIDAIAEFKKTPKGMIIKDPNKTFNVGSISPDIMSEMKIPERVEITRKALKHIVERRGEQIDEIISAIPDILNNPSKISKIKLFKNRFLFSKINGKAYGTILEIIKKSDKNQIVSAYRIKLKDYNKLIDVSGRTVPFAREVPPSDGLVSLQDRAVADQRPKPLFSALQKPIKPTLSQIKKDVKYKSSIFGDLITIKQARKELARFFTEKEVEFIIRDGLIRNSAGRIAYGQSTAGLIKVVKENGMVRDKLIYHEAFHQYLQQFLTHNEFNKLQIEMFKFSKALSQKPKTLKEAEERMADLFADYVAGRKTFTGKLLHFFESIILRIRKWIRMENEVMKTFEDIIAKKRPKEAITPKRGPPKYKKKPEKIPAELRLMSEQAKIKHLKDLASAIKLEGGLKTPTGMIEELSDIPMYLRNKNGFTPDEMVRQLAEKGFFYEDDSALLEAIKEIPGAKTAKAIETNKIQQRIVELKSEVVTETKEFEIISDELKEQIVPFFRPPRLRASKAFSLLGNKDTTIPLFSEIFDKWVKNGVEIIVEPYAGAYTLGTHSINQAIKSGLKEFHSNVFDKEKHIIIKAIQNGKIVETHSLVNKAIKTLNDSILKNAKSNPVVSKVLEDFISKNPTSYIGSNKWVVYMRNRRVGKEVLIYKDIYEQYRKVFQDSMDEMAKVEIVDLETAIINSFYKKIGIFGGKGQSFVRINGFVPFEDKIFGKFGMIQAFKDINTSFKLAVEHNAKIKIYNEDGIEFVKKFKTVPEKTAFYFDPPYVKSSKIYKEVGKAQLERFNSGYNFYTHHKNAFDMVKDGSKIALTNDVDQEYMSTILENITDSKIFAYKENNTPTSLIVDTTTGGTITDFIIEINEGRGVKAFKWANQEYLAKVIQRGGYTSKTIELLKRHNVPDDVINELKVEGKYLKNLVKVKKEITGEVSTTISKEALNYIARTSKIKTINKKWVKKVSFETVKGDALDVIQGYETGARFFFRIGEGFKNLVFDPIRAGERLAVKRAYSLKNIELKSVFKLNKKEAKQLWAYAAKQQGKEVSAPEFKKLPYKVRKAYIDIRRTTTTLYPIVNRITVKHGREIGNVKNYAPLYTKNDIKVFDEGGFNFTRKDPFFGSIIGREVDVPAELYEQDYRKVMESWVDGVSRYIDVGERTVGVKYLIDSREFQDIAGRDISKKISDWYRYIVSPPKVMGADKGLRVLRNLQAVSILGFKYTVPTKQFLNLFDFWTMLPAKRMMKAAWMVRGKSPVAKLAAYSGSVQERSLGLAVQDLKNTIIVWGRKPAEYTDKLTAKMGRVALLDQMITRNKANGIKITPNELKKMERRADDIVDAVMGAMSRAETPKFFRSELGKNINMFYSQLNSKMQYYVTDIFKNVKYAKMSGSKANLYAKALLAVLIAGYIESTINKLYFVDDPEDITRNSLRQIAGNFPIIGGLAFSLETGMPYSPMPVLANITRLTTAIARGQTETAMWTFSGFLGFPTQIKNILIGGRVIEKGGVYDKNGRLLFKVNEFPEKIRTLLKGKWGSKKAQEYFEPKDKVKEIKTLKDRSKTKGKSRLK